MHSAKKSYLLRGKRGSVLAQICRDTSLSKGRSMGVQGMTVSYSPFTPVR